jgi:predicted DCC family thiol-disulfide oxidoreductase YuxK
MSERPIFVFDGECVLCSRGVRFLMRHDRERRLAFTTSSSQIGAAAYARHGLDPNETYLLIEGDRAWAKSDGYLRLCTILGGAWRLLRIGRLVPRSLRDALYDLVARNRYRWFGKVRHCAMLSPDDRSRLLP